MEAHKYRGAKPRDMFIRELFQSILDMPGEFAGVATHDPLSAVLLAVGAILTTVAIGYFSLLALGSIAAVLTPEPGGQPRQPGQ